MTFNDGLFGLTLVHQRPQLVNFVFQPKKMKGEKQTVTGPKMKRHSFPLFFAKVSTFALTPKKKKKKKRVFQLGSGYCYTLLSNVTLFFITFILKFLKYPSSKLELNFCLLLLTLDRHLSIITLIF